MSFVLEGALRRSFWDQTPTLAVGLLLKISEVSRQWEGGSVDLPAYV